MVIPTTAELTNLIEFDFGTEQFVVKDDIFFRIFGIDMILPRGSTNNGASVPFFVSPFISKTDSRVIFWAMVHDYMYRTQYVSRLVADAILRAGLKHTANRFIAGMFYYVLRPFGWVAWYNNKKRGLEKYPEAKTRFLNKICNYE